MVGFTLATSHVDISVLGDFITCYTDVEGLEETRCSFSEGFTTCYTSYDISESNKTDVYICYSNVEMSVSNFRQTSQISELTVMQPVVFIFMEIQENFSSY